MVSVRVQIIILTKRHKITNSEIEEIYRECRKDLAMDDVCEVVSKKEDCPDILKKRCNSWFNEEEDDKETEQIVWKMVLDILKKI